MCGPLVTCDPFSRGCFALAHAQQCGLVMVLDSFIWLRWYIGNLGAMFRLLLNAFTQVVVLFTSLQGTKRQVRITAPTALMDAAFSPGDFLQTVQVCPVSPRVIWTNATSQHDQSEKQRVAAPPSWRQRVLEQYARSCRGMPALVHLFAVLGVTFYPSLWAVCVNLRSACFLQ